MYICGSYRLNLIPFSGLLRVMLESYVIPEWDWMPDTPVLPGNVYRALRAAEFDVTVN